MVMASCLPVFVVSCSLKRVEMSHSVLIGRRENTPISYTFIEFRGTESVAKVLQWMIMGSQQAHTQCDLQPFGSLITYPSQHVRRPRSWKGQHGDLDEQRVVGRVVFVALAGLGDGLSPDDGGRLYSGGHHQSGAGLHDGGGLGDVDVLTGHRHGLGVLDVDGADDVLAGYGDDGSARLGHQHRLRGGQRARLGHVLGHRLRLVDGPETDLGADDLAYDLRALGLRHHPGHGDHLCPDAGGGDADDARAVDGPRRRDGRRRRRDGSGDGPHLDEGGGPVLHRRLRGQHPGLHHLGRAHLLHRPARHHLRARHGHHLVDFPDGGRGDPDCARHLLRDNVGALQYPRRQLLPVDHARHGDHPGLRLGDRLTRRGDGPGDGPDYVLGSDDALDHGYGNALDARQADGAGHHLGHGRRPLLDLGDGGGDGADDGAGQQLSGRARDGRALGARRRQIAIGHLELTGR